MNDTAGKRASSAKDGGEQPTEELVKLACNAYDCYVPEPEAAEPALYPAMYAVVKAVLASQKVAEEPTCDCELVAHGKWKNDREIELCGFGDPEAMNLYICDSHLPSQMRPQSAVQGVPDWAWKQAFGLFVTNNEIMDEFNEEDFDEVKILAAKLADAPQPPQGEG